MSWTKVPISGDVLAMMLDLPPGTEIKLVDRVPPDDPADPVTWWFSLDLSDPAEAGIVDDPAPKMADLSYEMQETTAPVLVAITARKT